MDNSSAFVSILFANAIFVFLLVYLFSLLRRAAKAIQDIADALEAKAGISNPEPPPDDSVMDAPSNTFGPKGL